MADAPSVDLTPPPLGPRFEDALRYAAMLHAGQIRKESGIPYVAHLLSVAALVIEDGGDEDEAIAALLHDAAEDQGGADRLRAIAGRYGERVARIVHACSDTVEEPKPKWYPRKQAYLEHLPRHAPDELRVSLADKLHNARAILADYRLVGEALWSRFTGGRCGSLWYYRALVAAFRTAGRTGYLMEELERVVADIETLAAAAPPPHPATRALGEDCPARAGAVIA
jgi:GTP pyrophosphokinase